MITEITMPRLGITMDTGKVLEWYKTEGEIVHKEEPILLVESEKINTEVESPVDGYLMEILVLEGEEVPIGTVLGRISDTVERPAWGEAQPSPAVEEVGTSKSEFQPERQKRNREQKPSVAKVYAVPAARKRAKELGLKIENISPTGPHGEVLLRDVERTAQEVKLRITPAALKMAHDKELDLQRLQVDAGGERIRKGDVEALIASGSDERERIIHPTSMRKTIARRLSESFREVPHIYLTREIDVASIEKMRTAMNEKREGKVRISLNDILVKVSALALRRNPDMNRQWMEEGIRVLNTGHIGLAIAVEGGLIVPIIRDADRLTLEEIARQREVLVGKARERTLRPEEIAGASMTVTNLGNFGIDNFQAVINPPESCILAVGRVRRMPVVDVEGKVGVGLVLSVTLSVDHRVADGAMGAMLLQDMVRMIINPLFML